ncbi:branched-chain amino acid ABC transporter permease [Hoeflea alexandrii]|uniref:branched-chain amino acid ABC transporter permease n=1 Tax=Hoeflea alexandrii TaxID=288436 RepID=UPI0022AED6AF|nr:branched-chain amino acid ABC transporter permease [Hoeflea alexandrii]MCZ4291684.1 branched-chain amino acid ABC transporter permease [Hoeflea alexandrii]
MIRLVLIAAVAFGGIAFPYLLTSNYFIHLAILAIIWMIVAQGANVIQGYTGYVSIAQAGFMGIGAYSSALLNLNAGWPVWICMIVSPLITAAASLIAGYPSLRVKGHYFAIVTLALNMVIFIVLVNWIPVTGGEGGIAGIPAPESIRIADIEISFLSRVNYYYLVLAALGLVMLIIAALLRSRVGLVLQAIRQNETMAEAAGVACWRYKLFSFVFSASLAGFAGSLYAHYMSFLSPAPFSVDHSLNAILAVILGGSGTLAGPLVGAGLTVALPEILRIADSYRLIIYGVGLVIVVIFLPRGLVPWLSDLVRRAVRGRTGKPTEGR